MEPKDELRALLNECGASWDYGIIGEPSTRFNINGIDLTFTPTRGGLACSTVLTPAQVIKVTLSRENENAKLRNLARDMWSAFCYVMEGGIMTRDPGNFLEQRVRELGIEE